VTHGANSYRDAPEYQLAERVLKAWEAQPFDDDGFGDTVVLARAYMAMIEERQRGPNGKAPQRWHVFVAVDPRGNTYVDRDHENDGEWVKWSDIAPLFATQERP